MRFFSGVAGAKMETNTGKTGIDCRFKQGGPVIAPS
jgi:hypothetical protein